MSMPLSLIETMRLDKKGQVALLAYHLQRMQKSAQALGFTYSQADAIAALRPFLHQSHAQAQRLRMSLSTTGIFNVQCTGMAYTAQPVTIRLASQALPFIPAHLLEYKTTARAHWQNSESWLLQHPTFFDVIHYDQQGWISEGSRTNLYLYDGKQWITPPAQQNLLPGVYRQYLLRKNWVVEKPIHINQLHPRSILRVSNALRGWVDAKLAFLSYL